MIPKTVLLFFSALSLFPEFAFSQRCKVQSCDIANASGSTGTPFDPQKISKIKEVTAAGAKCIEQNYYKLGMPFPKGYTPKSSPPKGYRAKTYSRETRQSGVGEMMAQIHSLEKRQQPCKQHTLVWARGTMEPSTNGGMGFMFGKSLLNELSSSQPGKWSGVGVKYNPDFAGIYCVGLPGGLNCVDQITTLNARCPSTKFIVGGFSQGAMVAHNCVAFAPAKVKKQIAGVVVAGDPFNGAPIKGFPSSKIKTFCVAKDGVCGGQLNITAGHGAYSSARYSTEAKNWILRNI